MESPPFPITFLQDYIKNWRITEEGISIYPKHEECDEIILRPHSTFFIGEPLGWEFFAITKIVLNEKTGREAIEFYKRLKTAECELKWRGLIRKEPIFEIINSQGCTELAAILNVNKNLSKALKAANIDALRITLSSQRRSSEDNGIESDIPGELKEIKWVIMALKSYTLPIERLNMTKCKSDFINIFKALSEISKTLKRLSSAKLRT